MWFPFVFILEECGIAIKTTDDTTTDNYIAQGMYVYMCMNMYICMYQCKKTDSKRVGRDFFGSLFHSAFFYYTDNLITVKLVYLAFTQSKISMNMYCVHSSDI